MSPDIPRLDILIYAHDGRGLGHASRSIGIGLALRRLYPALRVLFVSGCKISQELIGENPLDWLKLPSYETEVVAGKSRGIAGHSMFSDRELGELRGAQLKQLVELYRPKVVLCDHTPQGKHRELVPALNATVSADTRWVLGVRGVVGGVPQATSELARELFENHYAELFWYGDSSVLGTEHMCALRKQYGKKTVECGYVSRLSEFRGVKPGPTASANDVAATVAIPWLGEKSPDFVQMLAQSIAQIGPGYGQWHIYIERADSSAVKTAFNDLHFCRLENPSGRRYVDSLLASRIALIYGGYNSIMDVLSLNLPAVVVLREMQDNEQQIHLQKLDKAAGSILVSVEESGVNEKALRAALELQLKRNIATGPSCSINLDGAECSARQLYSILQKTH